MSSIAALATATVHPSIASPSIANDGGQPPLDFELFEVWERRKAMIAQVRAMWTEGKSIDPTGHWYELHALPILKVVWDMERQVADLPPSINKAGALLMLSFEHVEDSADTIDDEHFEPFTPIALKSLEAVLPMLSGPIARDAQEFLSNVDRPICCAPFCSSN
ncbi:MAG: hypothetical protein EWM45_04810 [Rhodopseudomonas palustris]|nr:MAG: hypothetical protein EWM45_04810 [Rhodopseudomonas palustris]